MKWTFLHCEYFYFWQLKYILMVKLLLLITMRPSGLSSIMNSFSSSFCASCTDVEAEAETSVDSSRLDYCRKRLTTYTNHTAARSLTRHSDPRCPSLAYSDSCWYLLDLLESDLCCRSSAAPLTVPQAANSTSSFKSLLKTHFYLLAFCELTLICVTYYWFLYSVFYLLLVFTVKHFVTLSWSCCK